MTQKDLVWDVANRLVDGCYIDITYDSTRSDEVQEMRGKVTGVVAREGLLKINAMRDDGQEIKVTGEGELYSVGSDFPFTGEIRTLEVDYNDAGSLFEGMV